MDNAYYVLCANTFIRISQMEARKVTTGFSNSCAWSITCHLRFYTMYVYLSIQIMFFQGSAARTWTAA